MIFMKNLRKLQGSRKLLYTNLDRKNKSTCDDISQSQTTRQRKFKALQAYMQRDIHAPVYLIMGLRDKLLFSFTVGIIFVGLVNSFYTIYTFTKRPP